MIEAYKQEDGDYRLVGKTYYLRERIKALGGKWDGRNWTVPESALGELGCQKMIRVRVEAHCHEAEQDVMVPEKDVLRGFYKMGCGLCDTSYVCGTDVKIIRAIE